MLSIYKMATPTPKPDPVPAPVKPSVKTPLKPKPRQQQIEIWGKNYPATIEGEAFHERSTHFIIKSEKDHQGMVLFAQLTTDEWAAGAGPLYDRATDTVQFLAIKKGKLNIQPPALQRIGAFEAILAADKTAIMRVALGYYWSASVFHGASGKPFKDELKQAIVKDKTAYEAVITANDEAGAAIPGWRYNTLSTLYEDVVDHNPKALHRFEYDCTFSDAHLTGTDTHPVLQMEIQNLTVNPEKTFEFTNYGLPLNKMFLATGVIANPPLLVRHLAGKGNLTPVGQLVMRAPMVARFDMEIVKVKVKASDYLAATGIKYPKDEVFTFTQTFQAQYALIK